jgi:hypothetical protein
MMVRGRQAILVTIAAAALITTAAACEGAAQPAASTPTATARPGINPLKSLTSYQIIGKAFANTEAAANVQITGKVVAGRETTRLSSLTLVNGGSGCIGDIYRSNLGSFQLIYDGTTAWILPSLDYWQTAGKDNPAAVPAVEGNYLEVKPDGKSLGALVTLCSLKTLVGTGPSPARRTGFAAPAPTIVAGVPALKIADTADGGYAIVSDTTQPLLLSVFVPGRAGENFSFAYFATPVTMAAPPAAEVVDGSQYGF